jgi:hypothetical protein
MIIITPIWDVGWVSLECIFHISYFSLPKTREKYTPTMNMHPLSCSRRVSDGRKGVLISRQDEGSNSTFQKFPAKTRVRIQLFKSFPPRRGFDSVRFLRWCKNGGMKSGTKIAKANEWYENGGKTSARGVGMVGAGRSIMRIPRIYYTSEINFSNR